MRTAFTIVAACLICSACAEKPQPQPDPVALERLLASTEAEAVPPQAAAASSGGGDNAADIDRLENSIQKLDVDRVDPTLAAAIVAR